VLAAVVFAVGAPHAGAQEPEPGVTIDPDSPSSREYDIPLENARRNAQPGRDRDTPVPQGQRVAPLFGEGISSPDEGDAEPGGADAGGVKSETSSKRRPRAANKPPGEDAGPPATVRLAVSNPGAPNGGVSTSVLVLAGGALVVGLGAGAGVILRRRASRS
jgi:hypothetical protein